MGSPRSPVISQPTNLTLLEALADDFRRTGTAEAHDCDDHEVERLSAVGALPRRLERFRYLDYYARHYVRPSTTGPEVVDAVSTVTRVPMRFTQGGEPVTLVKRLRPATSDDG